MNRQVDREKVFHDRYFSGEVHREEQSRFYEPLSRRAVHSRVIELLRPADTCPPGRLLHYGCGYNVSYNELLASGFGYTVSAIDISVEAIDRLLNELAARGVAGVEVRQMDAHSLQFPDAHFDVVFGRGILHHLELDRAAREVHRVLKPGGIAVFVEPRAGNPLISLYRVLTPGKRTVDEHPLTEKDFDLLRRRFFRVSVANYFFLSLAAITIRPILGATYGGVLKMTMALDESLFRYLPFLQKYSWIAVMHLEKRL